MDELSAREEEVMALLIQGASNREIAQVLGLSARTVETYLHRIYKKLEAHNRTEAVARYLQAQEPGDGRLPRAGKGE